MILASIDDVMNTIASETNIRSANDLIGYKIDGRDESNIGKVKDFLFDDAKWTVRYLVADTGSWLSSHQVLISPMSLLQPNIGESPSSIPTKLTKGEIEDAPRLVEDGPVSRRYEMAHARFHGLHPYWVGPATFPIGNAGPTVDEMKRYEAELTDIDRCHVRSAKAVTGYAIQAKDSEVGHVKDFIIDTVSWMIDWMVVDTRNWLPGRKVMISPRSVTNIDWKTRQAKVELTEEQIKASPPFDPNEPVNDDYGQGLFDYYGILQ